MTVLTPIFDAGLRWLVYSLTRGLGLECWLVICSAPYHSLPDITRAFNDPNLLERVYKPHCFYESIHKATQVSL